MKFSPADKAREFLFVREAGQNRGLMVESIIHWSGGQPGDSWCAFFILFILDICFGSKVSNPITRSGAVQTMYDQAKRKKWLVEDPKKDDLFIYVNSEDHAHHIGIVTVDGGGEGIAGNTSEDGKSSNGDGVHEHALVVNKFSVKYIRFPRI
jgi:hypothetical protein